jgi:hypothetical protein
MGRAVRVSLFLASSIMTPAFLSGACGGDDSTGAGGSSGSGTGGAGGAAGSATDSSAGASGSGTKDGSTSAGGSAGTAGGGATGGKAGSGGSGGSIGTGGGAGVGGSGGSGGTGGAADASPTCSSADPAGTAMCGPGATCHISTCGPPAQYMCAPAGTGIDSSACTTPLDCAAGLTCLGYGGTLNFCKKYCTVDSDCGTGFLCIGELQACAGAVTGHYCEKTCMDPATPGSANCETGFKCSMLCSGTTTSLTCTPAGTQTSGTCAASGDCAGGYVCLTQTGAEGGMTSTCVQYCSPSVPCKTGACTGTLGCGGVANGFHFCQ